MTYATKQDLVDRMGALELIQLTDRTNMPPSTIDDVVVGRALDDADAMIDGYVSKRYALPLSPPPAVLTRIAVDLARYYLHGERVEKDGAVALAHKQAMDWLRDVSKGLVALVHDAAEPKPAGDGAIQANPSTRVMRRDTLEGF